VNIRLALGAIPYLLLLLGLFWPAINGPNLWFGFPSLVVWVSLCTVICTLVLLAYERMAEAGQ
jgi:hypothetical protein